tara:strand:+ start:1717 stop:2229 length:513 start_codon:yes stop_codon:yes gene_type:complete
MCDPVTAIAAITSVIEYQSQVSMANAQKSAADNAYALTNAQLHRRAQEEAIASGEASADTVKEAMIKRAEVNVSAGESGLAGISVAALLNEVSFEEGTILSRNERTLENRMLALQDEDLAAQGIRTQRYLNAPNPNIASVGLDIGSAYIGNLDPGSGDGKKVGWKDIKFT